MVLCFFTVRGAHSTPAIPLPFLILGLDMIGILCIRHTGDLHYGIDLLPFAASVLLSLLVQNSYGSSYFHADDALSATVLLLAMLICVILLTQRGYTHIIWKTVSTLNILAATCILLQNATVPLGVRLDKMGSFAGWLFNAWEFSDTIRLCGPFLEPAMYAQVGLLGLYDALFLRPSLFRATLTTTALVLSTSALALVGIVLLYGMYLFSLDRVSNASRRFKITLIALVVGLVAVSANFLLTSDIYIVQRALSGSSVGVRFLRSMDLYWLLNPLEKLFGIGLQNQQYYLFHHNITLAHDTYETLYENKEYASVLGYIPCTLGFWGLSTFLFPFLRCFFRGDLRTKTIVALLIYVCLFCNLMSNCIFVIYIMAVYSAYDLEQKLNAV